MLETRPASRHSINTLLQAGLQFQHHKWKSLCKRVSIRASALGVLSNRWEGAGRAVFARSRSRSRSASCARASLRRRHFERTAVPRLVDRGAQDRGQRREVPLSRDFVPPRLPPSSAASMPLKEKRIQNTPPRRPSASCRRIQLRSPA